MRRLVLAALLAAPMLASAKPATDGSFEAHSQGRGNADIHASLTGQAESAHGTESRSNGLGAASDGGSFIALANAQNGRMPQDVDTHPGKHYGLALGHAKSHGGSDDTVPLVAIVPEPDALVLMLAGLAALGFMARRRRQA